MPPSSNSLVIGLNISSVQSGPDERRRALRRLDDILEALEQLNLHERKVLPVHLTSRLRDLGIDDPAALTIPQLIEKVWGQQQPHLITVKVERRRRRRRKVDLRAIAQ